MMRICVKAVFVLGLCAVLLLGLQLKEDHHTVHASPLYGGTVVVYSPQDLDYLDPHRYAASGTQEIMLNVFEGLVKPAPDGSVVPAVAKEYSISDDHRTYTFTLREGIRFHNGDEVTVEDVQYSLQRMQELVGGELNNIKEVQILDDSRVQVSLKEVDAAFLTHLVRGVIPESNEGKHNQQPIGTGPFKFIEYIPEVRVVLEKNPYYWQEGLPYLDRAEFRIIPDRETAFMAFQAGQLDIYPRLDHIHMETLGDQYTFITGLENLVQIMAMNNAIEPFDDIRVRQAINYAVDVDEIIELVAYGYGEKLGSNFSPAMEFYYLEGLEDVYDRDLDKAQVLLKEAGYEDGFSMTIKVPSNYDFHVDTAQVIASQLEAVNIDVSLQLIEWGVWLDDVYQGRNYEATIIALSGKLDPHQVLRRYTSDYARNFFNYENSQYDRLIQGAILEVDETVRVEKYQEAQAILSQEVPCVFIMDRVFNVALHPELNGFKIYPIYLIDLTHIHYTE